MSYIIPSSITEIHPMPSNPISRKPSGEEEHSIDFAVRDIHNAHTTPPLAIALNLAPHPEGGWYRETWRTVSHFQPDGYLGERVTATAIYFVLGKNEESRWHKVRSDEMWIWNIGSPIDLILGGNGDRPSTSTSVIRLGQSIEEDEQPQGLVPGGIWQMAKPVRGDVLVTCIVSPGFDYQDFTLLEEI